jgi:hypothetical protein
LEVRLADGRSVLVPVGFDPTDLRLFVFRSKRQDRIKRLYGDADGYAIRMKKPESDCTHSFPFTGFVGWCPARVARRRNRLEIGILRPAKHREKRPVQPEQDTTGS